MQKLLNQLMPFLLIGIAIVAFAFGIILLAYLFLFGAILGFILFITAWIRNKFFPSKKSIKPSGRVIDSDEWRKM
jgi:hypothetical protein